MANTLKIKRGLAASIPQGQLAEPLFTTDTYDLYIGKGAGGNQRIQNYIASGTSSQFLKGDGSLDSTTYQTALTFTSPLVNTSGTVSIPVATSSVNGYLTSTDWTTFNSKEPAITAGTTSQYYRGDKTFQTLDTAAVPENGAIYFTEPRVRATVLTGLNLSGGGTISASDSVLTAFGKVQNQISALVGGATYQGTWNANTNTPTLASGTGTKGFYYVVSVAGSTNLDGITDWKVGDWAIFNGTTWDKVDNTDAVSSVNGFTGAVNLALDNISDVSAASPTNAQLLRFNGTSSLWEAWTPTYISSAITSLNGLTAASQTFANDTNVTITSTSSTHTIGWSGQLAIARGGTGLSALGTAGQLLRVNSGATALEYFTPTYISAAITSLNGLTDSVQTFATGTTGTDFNISSASGVHTFNIPSASASNRGLVTTGTQTFAGDKTISGGFTVSGSSAAFTGTAFRLFVDRANASNVGTIIFTTGGANVNNGWAEIGQTSANGDLYFKANVSAGSYDTTMVLRSNQSADLYGPLTISSSSLNQLNLSNSTTGPINITLSGWGNGLTYPQARIQLDDSGNYGGLFKFYTKPSGSATGALALALTIADTRIATFTNVVNATAFIPTGSTVPTNGMYLSAANTLSLSTNSTRAITIDAGQKVGIGADPISAYRLYVNGDIYASATVYGSIASFTSGGTFGGSISATGGTFSGNVIVNTTTFAQVKINNAATTGANRGTSFEVNSTTNAGTTFLGQLNAISNNANAPYNSTDAIYLMSRTSGIPLIFTTNNGGTEAERMRITSGGNVEIAAGSLIAKSTGTGTPAVYVRADSGSNNGTLGFGNSTDYRIRGGSDYGAMIFDTAGAERMRITSGGAVQAVNNLTANSPSEGNTGEGIIAGRSFKIDASGTGQTAKMYVVSKDLSDTYGNGLQIQFAKLTNDAGFGFNLTTAGAFETYIKAGAGSWVRTLVMTSGSNVGINTNSVDRRLTINSGSSEGTLGLTSNNGVEIDMVGYGTGFSYPQARIKMADAGFYGGILTFHTKDNGAQTNGLNERIRITQTGVVGINNNAPNTSFLMGLKMTEAVKLNGIDIINAYQGPGTGWYYISCYNSTNGVVALQILGNGNVVNANNSYAGTSDIKLKENIKDATPKLQDLLKVKIKNYNFIGDDKKQIGVIAQELENIFPALVEDVKDYDASQLGITTTTKVVKYSVFVPMLIKAIQEQQAQIEELKSKLA